MRFKDTLVAVMVLLRNENKVLLQKRINTGYMDGFWDFSATGHVEFGESFIEAGIREAKEEIGIDVKKENFQPMTIMHKFTKESQLTYVNAFFVVDEYNGNASIMEEDKCSELQWFDLNELPEDLIFDRAEAIKAMKEGNYYQELGW